MNDNFEPTVEDGVLTKRTGCAPPKRIAIPKGVREIGERAFAGCESLTLRGAPGRYAAYAERKGLRFASMTEEEDGES